MVKMKQGKCAQKTPIFLIFIIFCSRTEKINQENKESIVKIALVSDSPISYNVVTKVTTSCF